MQRIPCGVLANILSCGNILPISSVKTQEYRRFHQTQSNKNHTTTRFSRIILAEYTMKPFISPLNLEKPRTIKITFFSEKCSY
jgi:hypothetical protein